MHAIESLEAGLTVQRIALELGYTTPSAFIVMFKRFTGTTPEQYRLNGLKQR
ncbi:helix-turn-helix domain-containing protein [Klebsiella pneumoniae]|uniref:helix-turn-helix domain-containing protein n=2 Tax=Klebsiella TaxID=570 RepID=UPI001FEEE276|nr:helix-turn-helix domain-containing protein [Klebsiella pneumoniae]